MSILGVKSALSWLLAESHACYASVLSYINHWKDGVGSQTTILKAELKVAANWKQQANLCMQDIVNLQIFLTQILRT